MPSTSTKCPPSAARLSFANKSNSYIFAVEHNPVQTPPVTLCVSDLLLESNSSGDHTSACTSFFGDDASGNQLLLASAPMPTRRGEQRRQQQREQRPPLSIEQIERCRHEPNWRRMRLIFYSAWWLGLLCSLLFALLLVHLHPMCVPSPTQREWWRSAVIYEIWTLSFHGSDGNGIGGLAGIQRRFDHLRRIGVGAVFIRPILRTESTGMGVINFTALGQQIAGGTTMDEFDVFVDAAHRKGIRVLLDLPLAVTSTAHPWFRRSALAVRPENVAFADFYHWHRSVVPSTNSAFVSAFDGSMLEYFHVAQRPDLPVLNWQNANVSGAVRAALSFWIGRGVDGFHLSAIEYLHRTADGQRPAWDKIIPLVKSLTTYAEEQWRIRRRDDNGVKIFLYTSHEHLSEAVKVRMVDEAGLDAVVNTELRNLALGSRVCSNSTTTPVNAWGVAECLNEIVADLLLFHQSFINVWPLWSVGGPFTRRLASRVDGKVFAELTMLVQLVLPGTPIIYYGDELGLRDVLNLKFPQRGTMPWDPSSSSGNGADTAHTVETNFEDELANSRSFLHSIRSMARLRLRVAALTAGNGRTYITKRADGPAFALCRYLCCRQTAEERRQRHMNSPGTEGATVYGDSIVALVNFGSVPLTFSLCDLPPFHRRGPVYQRGRIVARSSNAGTFALGMGIKLNGRQIRIGAREGIIFNAFEL